MGGGVSERWTGLLEGPRAGDPSSLCAAMVAGEFLPSCAAGTMPHLNTEKKLQKKHTRAEALLITPGLPLWRPLGRLCFLPGPFLLIFACVFSLAWSANHHIYKPAFEPDHPAHTLVELLPDNSPAVTEGLGCSLILHRPIFPWSEYLLLYGEEEWARRLIMTLFRKWFSSLDLFHKTSQV